MRMSYFHPRRNLDPGAHVPRRRQPGPRPDRQCSQAASNTVQGLTLAEGPGPVLRSAEDAQYAEMETATLRLLSAGSLYLQKAEPSATEGRRDFHHSDTGGCPDERRDAQVVHVIG